ncbi:MAG TPA: protein kinase [Planctomycetota bacterium]|nr:protein kinase [Planctomycetota bacterium]
MRTPREEEAIANRLIAMGRLSAEDLRSSLADTRRLRRPLLAVLLERGLTTERDVAEASRTHDTANIHDSSGVEPDRSVRPEERETYVAPRASDRLARDESQRSLGEIGHYTITGELGRGGMGVVYKAYDRVLKRNVAVKMILDPTRAGRSLVERFRAEASAVARLHDPRIVSVFEVGEHDEKPYIVMELVDGRSLEQLLQEEELSERRIAEVLRDTALALQHAHDNGIIHRDVKPENVLVDRAGGAHLMDFGLAQDLAATTRLTVAGQILGTPAYMAPEQASGTGEVIGPRADVYALGAVLYRALAGRPPFEGSAIQELIYRVLTEEPKAPRTIRPDIHPDLETIALRCLTKEQGRRYESAAAVAEELRRFLDGEPLVARPVGSFERLWRRARRNRRTVVVGALLAAAATAGVLWLRTRHEQELARERADNARKTELLRKAQATASIEEGERFLAAHSQDAAIACATSAIELDPSRGDAWSLRASAYFEKGDSARALADSEKAIEVAPNHARGWLGRASVRANRREAAGAIADATKAIELDPKNPRGWHARAAAKFNSGDIDGGLEDASHEILLDPKEAEAWELRAECWFNKGDYERAIADASESIRLSPKYAHAYYTRAASRATAGDLEQALEDANQAVRLAPALPEAWLVRMITKARMGDDRGAIADATKTIELAPTRAQAWLIRAASHENLGEKAEAIRDFERYLELEPVGRNADSVRKTLENMKKD